MAAGPGVGGILIPAATPKYFIVIGGFVIINLLFLVDLIPLTRGEAGVVVQLAPPPTDKNPPPKFTLSFNVEEWDDEIWDRAYQDLIESLRTRLGSGSRWEPRLGVPVLHPQAADGQAPPLWFHLVLERGGEGDITLRIRGDNLYVVGFRRSSGDVDDGQWWEFREREDKKNKKKPPPPPALIHGSKPLGFSCNYNHLEGPRVADQFLTKVGLGRHQLRSAVAQLATVRQPDQNPQPTARSLLAVVVMVAEATRFTEIADLLIQTRNTAVIHLTPRMDTIIRGWADISEYIFRAQENPNHSLVPLRLTRESTVVVIPTPSAALLLLGILLLPRNCPWSPPRILLLAAAPSSSLQEDVHGSSGGGGHCAQGRPLLEVISVVINDIDGEDPGQLYGTVKVTDALGSQSIYKSDRYNYENVSPGKAATLTGPADRAISAVGAVTIDLDLWDRDFTALNPDDQVSKGAVEWDHFAFAERYDMRHSQTVDGTYGSATVNYVVFSDAVEAKFEVTLIQGNDGQQDEVYGRVVARIGDLGIESVLLSTTSSDYSQVWYGDRIPLQRTIVAVPLSSYIRVSALLYDYDSDSADDEIAGGCTHFGAKSSGTTRWRITGQSGEIEIKVTWNPSY